MSDHEYNKNDAANQPHRFARDLLESLVLMISFRYKDSVKLQDTISFLIGYKSICDILRTC